MAITAVQEGDWILIPRVEGPRHRLKAELNRVLGTDFEQVSEQGDWRIAPSAWSAALDIFRRMGIGVALTPADVALSVRPNPTPWLQAYPHPELLTPAVSRAPAATAAPEETPAPAPARAPGPPEVQAPLEEENVMQPTPEISVRQRASDDERAVEQEIEELRTRMVALEQKREEIRMFLSVYERYEQEPAGAFR